MFALSCNLTNSSILVKIHFHDRIPSAFPSGRLRPRILYEINQLPNIDSCCRRGDQSTSQSWPIQVQLCAWGIATRKNPTLIEWTNFEDYTSEQNFPRHYAVRSLLSISNRYVYFVSWSLFFLKIQTLSQKFQKRDVPQIHTKSILEDVLRENNQF